MILFALCLALAPSAFAASTLTLRARSVFGRALPGLGAKKAKEVEPLNSSNGSIAALIGLSLLERPSSFRQCNGPCITVEFGL